jgi:hypothetical protein
MGALTVIAGVFLAALASHLAFEFRDWTPRWTELLINRAVRRLPADLQDRMSEEWREFVSDAPGHFAKLTRALGLGQGARRIALEHSGEFAGNFWQRSCTKILGLSALTVTAPLLILLIVCLALRGGPIFEKSADRNFYRFRIANDEISQILKRSNFAYLPGLWNVTKGDVTFSWSEMKTIILGLPRLIFNLIVKRNE